MSRTRESWACVAVVVWASVAWACSAIGVKAAIASPLSSRVGSSCTPLGLAPSLSRPVGPRAARGHWQELKADPKVP